VDRVRGLPDRHVGLELLLPRQDDDGLRLADRFELHLVLLRPPADQVDDCCTHASLLSVVLRLSVVPRLPAAASSVSTPSMPASAVSQLSSSRIRVAPTASRDRSPGSARSAAIAPAHVYGLRSATSTPEAPGRTMWASPP